MTNTESPVTLATRGLLIGRRDGHLTPEATDTNLEALAGETPDTDARDLGLLLACMGKLSESFSAEKPAQDAAALLRSKVANNQHGSLTELLGDHLAQVLVRVEPLSDWTGMLYPGINALYNDGTEALLDLDEDRFGAVLADLTDRVRPFTPDGQAATQMLASIVQMATEVSPFNPQDLAVYTQWLAGQGTPPVPVEIEPANEDWTCPAEAAWLLAVARDYNLTLDEALIVLARVVNVIWTFV
jgi:hypothetical protein